MDTNNTTPSATAPAGQFHDFYPFNHKWLVLADEHHAVIKSDSPMPGFSGHCGYCVFKADEVPVEWHGEYVGVDADAHGGLTYAEIEGGDVAGRLAALKALWAEKQARYDAGEPATLWAEYYKRGKALARTFPYTHVVFGFDCAHYRDNKDSALHDASYVFNLAQRMRESILAAIQRRNAP